jgi:hypothetical protein
MADAFLVLRPKDSEVHGNALNLRHVRSVRRLFGSPGLQIVGADGQAWHVDGLSIDEILDALRGAGCPVVEVRDGVVGEDG